jgi:very-short-patch-repair endonuclease
MGLYGMRERHSENEQDKSTPQWWERLSTSRMSPSAFFGRSNQIIAKEIKSLFSSKSGVDTERAEHFLESRRCFLNHVALADILNRLSEQLIESDVALHASLQKLGVTVLRAFLAPEIKPGPRELATVWRAVGYLELQDGELDVLARRVKRLQGAFEPIDFAFTITGLACSPHRSKAVKEVLKSCCASFKGMVCESPPEALVAVLRGLCRGRCTDPELVDEIIKEFIDRDRKRLIAGSGESLAHLTFAARCNAVLRRENGDVMEYVTQQLQALTNQPYENWRDVLGVEAAADYVWGCAALSHPIPRPLAARLEQHIHNQLPFVFDPRKRYIFATVAMPALMMVAAPPSTKTTGAFQQLESKNERAGHLSNLEREVERELTSSLNVRFKREFPLGPYRFDFLLESRDGRVIDLEIDGDSHHLLYDISAALVSDRYRGGDIIRDKFVRSCGIEVVRILASEWGASRDKVGLLREKLGL